MLPDRVHQIMVHDAGPSAWLAVNQAAIARHPHLPVHTGVRQHSIGKACKAEQRQLRIIKLLAAEFLALFRMRIDENGGMPGSAQHGGGSGTCEPGADNGHISFQHIHAAASLENSWSERTRRNSASDCLILLFSARPARQKGATG